jgi:hypothetical protein
MEHKFKHLMLYIFHTTAWYTNLLPNFIFCWPCISLRVLANNQLGAVFHVFIYLLFICLFIYFMSLHSSSATALIIRRSNCINTSSGMISLCKWLLGSHVLNVICFLLGNSPASEFYMATFRNTLSHLHKQVGVKNDFAW